jgi:hypothetical protein
VENRVVAVFSLVMRPYKTPTTPHLISPPYIFIISSTHLSIDGIAANNNNNNDADDGDNAVNILLNEQTDSGPLFIRTSPS